MSDSTVAALSVQNRTGFALIDGGWIRSINPSRRPISLPGIAQRVSLVSVLLAVARDSLRALSFLGTRQIPSTVSSRAVFNGG